MAEPLGRRIRQARERYGMSQAELARRIGISGTALNQIESGKTPDPGVSRILGIARVLGVSPNDLLGWREGQSAPVQPKPPALRTRPRKAAPVS